MTGSVGDRNMNQARMILLALAAAAAGLAGCSPAPDASNAPPASYTVDGQQYIVVAAGGNTQLDFKRGNDIIAFTLAE